MKLLHNIHLGIQDISVKFNQCPACSNFYHNIFLKPEWVNRPTRKKVYLFVNAHNLTFHFQTYSGAIFLEIYNCKHRNLERLNTRLYVCVFKRVKFIAIQITTVSLNQAAKWRRQMPERPKE